MSITIYEDNAGSVYVERAGEAWDIGPVTTDLQGAAATTAAAWHAGDWEPNVDDGQTRARIDDLPIIATWTPVGLSIEYDDNGDPVAGAGGQAFLGIST